MEKAISVQFEKVWSEMGMMDRFEVVKAISMFQKIWMSASCAQYGSLYYSSGLDYSDGGALVKKHGSEVKRNGFTVGPSTGREFIDNGRIPLDFDRDPSKLFDLVY